MARERLEIVPPKDPERKRQYDRARYASLDKEKVMADRSAYYLANKETILARNKAWSLKRKEEIRGIVLAIKAGPCMDCDQCFHFCAMDFDHRDSTLKVASVSEMMCNRYMTKERILAEIAKCDLVCANCHRLRTFNRMGILDEQ